MFLLQSFFRGRYFPLYRIFFHIYDDCLLRMEKARRIFNVVSYEYNISLSHALVFFSLLPILDMEASND
jgi:hypothetical protein